MADFIVGSPARDDDFWFRAEFLEDLWEALEKHNVLLLAPRRTGKTSVMYRMLDHPRNVWLVIHLNVEDLKTPGDFIVSLIDAIHEHQPRYLREALAKGWSFVSGVLARIEKIEAFELKLELRKSEDLKTKWQERAAFRATSISSAKATAPMTLQAGCSRPGGTNIMATSVGERTDHGNAHRAVQGRRHAH